MSIFSRFFGRPNNGVIEAQTHPNADPKLLEPAPGPSIPLSPLSIGAVERAADSGNMSMAADLCRKLLGDGRVQAALAQRIGGLLAMPLHWEDGSKKSARAKKAIIDDFPQGLRECDLFALYSWGLLLGVSVAEIIWKESETGRLVPSLKVWDPRWLRYNHDKDGWSVILADTTEAVVTKGDGHWVLYTPRGERNPWRNGLWRALNKPYYVKEDASLTWARYNEVHGSPIRLFKGSQGMSKRQLDAAADSVDTSHGFTSAAIPYGTELDLVEATGNTWNTFQSAIDWAATEISIAILGQNLTTQVDGGSLAASKTHRDIERNLVQGDAETESTFLREQILSWWALYNFGDASVAPWPKRQTEEPENLEETAAILKGCGDAVLALRTAGFSVDMKAMAEKFGIPLDATPTAQEPGQNGRNSEPPVSGEALAKSAPQGQSTATASGIRMAAKAATQSQQDDLPNGAAAGFDAIDAMADLAEKKATPIIENQSDIILRVIDEATDEEDLERRLRDAFVEMESGELCALLERALVLAELTGRWSALEDV